MITHLPYVEPEKNLTAYSRPKNLREHFLAFLALHGFKVKESEPNEQISETTKPINSVFEITDQDSFIDILLFVTSKNSFRDDEMKLLERLVFRKFLTLSSESETSCSDRKKLSKLLIARAMGYPTWGPQHKKGVWYRRPGVSGSALRSFLFGEELKKTTNTTVDNSKFN